VHYEATRAGLDPQLVLSVIQVESNFRKYAVSTAGARGYMQVMPFWVDLIGTKDHNLFHLRTNLRYGCLILRHYLDIEHGNLTRALGRYNGSLGQSWYPDMVQKAWKSDWQYSGVSPTTGASSGRVAANRP
jgi:soluble lytic murein transglycosylase-like protein